MTVADQADDDAPPGSIQVVSRAVLVLRALHDHPDGLTLSRLTEAVSLPRSTVHRILAALRVEGLVASGEPGRLVLGPELFRLAGHSRASLREALRPVMLALSEELQETVDLAVLDGDGLATDREEHTEGICAMGFAVGDPAGVHATLTVPAPVQRFHGREQVIVAALLTARDTARAALEQATGGPRGRSAG